MIFYILYTILFLYGIFYNVIHYLIIRHRYFKKSITIKLSGGFGDIQKGDVLKFGSNTNYGLVTDIKIDNGCQIVTLKPRSK